MRSTILLGLLLANIVFSATAHADSYDSNGVMDGLTTRVVSSKGITKIKSVPAWIKAELDRQTAANKKDHKVHKDALKVSKISKDAAPKASNKIISIATLSPSDMQQAETLPENVVNYVPRIYHSQYYMPYSGHVSVPEPETDYR